LNAPIRGAPSSIIFDTTPNDIPNTTVVILGKTVFSNSSFADGWEDSATVVLGGSAQFNLSPPDQFFPRSGRVGISVTVIPDTLFYHFEIIVDDEQNPRSKADLRAIDFPFRYVANGNVVLTSDEKNVENNLRLSIFVHHKQVPLATHLGSRVPALPFDPNDNALRQLVSQEAIRAAAAGEPRAILDPSLRVIDEPNENKASLAFAYRIRGTQNWRPLLLSLPSTDID
jgi:hypothetical protein